MSNPCQLTIVHTSSEAILGAASLFFDEMRPK